MSTKTRLFVEDKKDLLNSTIYMLNTFSQKTRLIARDYKIRMAKNVNKAGNKATCSDGIVFYLCSDSKISALAAKTLFVFILFCKQLLQDI